MWLAFLRAERTSSEGSEREGEREKREEGFILFQD